MRKRGELVYAIHQYLNDKKMRGWIGRKEITTSQEDKWEIVQDLLIGDFLSWDGKKLRVLSNPSFKYQKCC